MIKHLFVYIVLLLFSCPLLIGQEIKQFTLKEAENYALENNEQVKNRLLDIESAKKRIWESTAIGLPQVNVEADFQYFIDVPTTVADASVFNPNANPGELVDFRLGTNYNSKAAINVSQLIFDGSYIVGLKAAKNFKLLVDKQLTQTKNDIRYQIKNAYIGVLIAQENIVLIDSLLNTTELLFAKTKRIFENGLISEIEIDQLELTLNNVKNAQKRSERNVTLSKNLLKFQMGYSMDADIELTETIEDFIYEVKKDLNIQPEGFIQNHIDYLVLQEQRELNELNRQFERSRNYPSLGGFFTHNQQAFRNDFDFFTNNQWFPTTVVGIQLRIPITSSGMRLAQEAQKKIVVDQIDNNLNYLERSLQLQFEQNKARYFNAYDVYQNETKNMGVAAKIFKNTTISKNEGFAGALQVTQAQNQYINSQQTYIGALYELFEAKTDLDKLLNNSKNEE